jgi:hypothetical protein
LIALVQLVRIYITQAERWGAELRTEDVVSVDFSQRPFLIRGTETTVRAQSVIVATGATAKRCADVPPMRLLECNRSHQSQLITQLLDVSHRLGIPNEDKFWSNGISACAICDGESAFLKLLVLLLLHVLHMKDHRCRVLSYSAASVPDFLVVAERVGVPLSITLSTNLVDRCDFFQVPVRLSETRSWLWWVGAIQHLRRHST